MNQDKTCASCSRLVTVRYKSGNVSYHCSIRKGGKYGKKTSMSTPSCKFYHPAGKRIKTKPKHHFAIDVNVSPETEAWLATKGKELERSFLLNLAQAIDHADKINIPYSKISIEGLMDYCRNHKKEL